MAWLRCRDQSFYPVESLKEQFSSRFFSIASLMTFTSASFVGCPLIVRRTAKILTFDRNQCFIHPLIVCTIFQLPIEIISSILFLNDFISFLFFCNLLLQISKMFISRYFPLFAIFLLSYGFKTVSR